MLVQSCRQYFSEMRFVYILSGYHFRFLTKPSIFISLTLFQSDGYKLIPACHFYFICGIVFALNQIEFPFTMDSFLSPPIQVLYRALPSLTFNRFLTKPSLVLLINCSFKFRKTRFSSLVRCSSWAKLQIVHKNMPASRYGSWWRRLW